MATPNPKVLALIMLVPQIIKGQNLGEEAIRNGKASIRTSIIELMNHRCK